MFEPIIGLEVHIELSTKSKMFCGCENNHFGKPPNSIVCPICLGLPGALPYPNIEAIKYTAIFGMVFNCQVNNFSKFDRKHYFYPDLPKGFQISQYDMPLCINGKWISKDGKIYRIRRIHLEEDTGKLQHEKINGIKYTLVDFNRSGVPLVELVTQPDFSNPDDVVDFLKDVQLCARYLGISNADMEKGSMRLEANVSLRKKGEIQIPNYKIELKNINSFRFLKKALLFEIERQEKILEKGQRIIQETRGYDSERNITYSQRTKEESKDYRYFPEPDIPPILLDSKFLNEISDNLIESPWEKRQRFAKKYNLPADYIEFLIQDISRARFFEELVNLSQNSSGSFSPQLIANLIVNRGFDKKYPNPSDFLNELAKSLNKDKVSILKDEEIEKLVESVIGENPKAVEDYHKGKTNVVDFLMGFVQREIKGKGDIAKIREIIIKKLSQVR